jgi:hypothetical protein
MGSVDLGNKWLYLLNNTVPVGLEELNAYTRGTLRELWPDLNPQWKSTVFHFMAVEGGVQVFKFASDDNFEAEQMPSDGKAFKPPFEGCGDHSLAQMSDWIGAMSKQRAEQAGLPLSEQTPIGGEMIVATLSGDGAIQMWVAHRFEDYDVQLNTMLEAYAARQRAGVDMPHIAHSAQEDSNRQKVP